jgi:hypothetical protein
MQGHAPSCNLGTVGGWEGVLSLPALFDVNHVMEMHECIHTLFRPLVLV